MCDFPSWIIGKDEKIYFCTDKDLERANIPYVDGVGHHAVRRVWGNIEGDEEERFPCPPVIATAIRQGKMRKMMKAAGYERISVTLNGVLHRDDGPAVEYVDGSKFWYRNGEQVAPQEG